MKTRKRSLGSISGVNQTRLPYSRQPRREIPFFKPCQRMWSPDKVKIAVVHLSRFSSQERTRVSAAIVVGLEIGAVAEEAAPPPLLKADIEAEVRVTAKVDVEAEEAGEHQEEVEVASVVGDVDEASRTIHHQRLLT
jgi:hypothetical protein